MPLAPKVEKQFDAWIARLEGEIETKPEEDYEPCPSWFHDGQKRMWECVFRIVLCLCGKQSGKTLSGPRWLRREMQRTVRKVKTDDDPPNDYIVAGPTLALLHNKAIPEFLRVFPDDPDWGYYDKAKNKYHFTPKGARRLVGFETPITVHFGYAANPDSLAAMTAKAAWLDEAGQVQFKRDSFEEILARLTISEGRCLITTTAYISTGWLRDLYEDAKSNPGTEVGLVQYKTEDLGKKIPGIMKTVVAAKKRMPLWKFRMSYEGVFEKGPGAVYDCFDGEWGQVKAHTVERFPIPKEWKRFWGLDFGPVHTCCAMFAEDPSTKKLFLYACYFPADEKAGGRQTYNAHADAMRRKDAHYSEDRKHVPPTGVFGGAKNEDNHRGQFQREGIPVQAPRYENDVARQTECVYGALKDGKFVVFNDLKKVISEFTAYSYKIDEEQNVDDTKIESKETYHRLDAVRYCIATIRPGFEPKTVTVSRFGGVSKKAPLPFRM